MPSFKPPSISGIWGNSKNLERLEIGILVSLAIVLLFIQNTFSQYASVTSFYLFLMLFSGVFYAGKWSDALQTVGFGKSLNRFALAVGVGSAFGFVLSAFAPSLYNPYSAAVIWAGVFAPLVEETFFRGGLQPTLIEWSGNLHVGVIGSALAFGGFHYLVSVTAGAPILPVVSFVFGAVMGYGNIFFESTGFSYAAHLVYNAKRVGLF